MSLANKESDIQAQVLEWLFMNKIFHWRSPNYSAPGRTFTGKKGLADITCILDDGQMIWLEIKSANGKQSIEQIQFQREVEKRGHIYILTNSVDDFIKKFKPVLASQAALDKTS